MAVFLQHQQVSTYLSAGILKQVVGQSIGTYQTCLLQHLCQLLAVAVQIVRGDDVSLDTAIPQTVQTFQHVILVYHLSCIPAHLIVALAIGSIKHVDVAKRHVGGHQVIHSQFVFRKVLEAIHIHLHLGMAFLCAQHQTRQQVLLNCRHAIALTSQ